MPAEAAKVQPPSVQALLLQIAELRRDVNGYSVLFEDAKRELDSERSTREALERRSQEREAELAAAQARVGVLELDLARWQQGVRDANRIAQRFEEQSQEARRDATRARLDLAHAKARAEDLAQELRQTRAQLRVVEVQRDAATEQRDVARLEVEALLPAQPVVLDMVPRPTAQPVVLVPDPALDIVDE